MTPLKAIRAKCLDCSNDSPAEVKLCPIITCPLYGFRLGSKPATESKRPLSQSQRQALEKGRTAQKSLENVQGFPENQSGQE